MLTPPVLLGRAAARAAALTAALVADRVRSWSAASQQGARRNAMVAATACAQRRAERQDVDAYLALRAPGAPVGVEGQERVVRA